MSKAKIKEMMREARLLQNFKHRNVVRPYGIAVDEQPLYITLELAEGGSLNVHLKTSEDAVSVSERMSMCEGSHKKSSIFTARIVFIWILQHVIVSIHMIKWLKSVILDYQDWALTERKLPVRWLAPETISTFTFMLKTDVYSYAMMVYEIFTSGIEAWDGLFQCTSGKAVLLSTEPNISGGTEGKLNLFSKLSKDGDCT
ncbi:hypothetical protein KIN20_031585 [Parelaphostrongylus tenuis]|uniref:Protein kinase domain-containing protein n=1 Tax=Parelaphostrongylus tenuis TaxID=148309 RepID=A0AAD5WHB7_PARTN|nr:hypothetical protein KIN20_031585 [Parelaphostrongylus tenuis]